ncbi:hypothetical protein GBA63_14465 [Rubrobacter tropicus]|uniref:Uncharacterized protein n=1 Tax=Rubrobacter tropicus TaxID=2653851 RepID=A0A6G8QB58_9ACTN|nr:hypothetical protein [Rubrobacter tropicus]QIN83699.1 hypothetical protein GBA63_14465 [Rubrobacter tropicus]
MKRPEAEARQAGMGAGRNPTAEERKVLVERCEACGTEMYGLHCKLVCPNCGYKRDCSDP